MGLAEQLLATLTNLAALNGSGLRQMEKALKEWYGGGLAGSLIRILELHQASAMVQHQGFRLLGHLIGAHHSVKPMFQGIGDHVGRMRDRHGRTPVNDSAELLLEMA